MTVGCDEVLNKKKKRYKVEGIWVAHSATVYQVSNVLSAICMNRCVHDALLGCNLYFKLTLSTKPGSMHETISFIFYKST